MIVPDLVSFAQPVESLTPLEGNPRRGDLEALAGSLERFGQRKPIVARASDRVVIAGNHTLAAAVSLGWTEVAVLFVDEDAETSKAFAAADNRASDLGWYDEQALTDFLKGIPELQGTGYTEEYMFNLLNNSLQDDGTYEEALSREQKLQTYMDKQIKNLILPYSMSEYAQLEPFMAQAREKCGCVSNSELFARLVRDYIA